MNLPSIDKYPKDILILNEWYKIKLCKTVRVGGQSVVGACDPNRREIRIKIAEPIVMFQTFIHEILHALSFEYDFNLTHEVIGALEGPIANLFLHNF